MQLRLFILTIALSLIVQVASAAAPLQRVERESTIQLNGAIDKIFPLFDPIGEATWAEGWTIHRIYSSSGLPEKGFVFSTTAEDGTETVWIISELNYSHRLISYFLFTPGLKVGQIDISLQNSSEGKTTVNVKYIYTALNEEGNKFVTSFSEEKFREKMHLWQTAINYYLETGKRFHHH